MSWRELLHTWAGGHLADSPHEPKSSPQQESIDVGKTHQYWGDMKERAARVFLFPKTTEWFHIYWQKLWKVRWQHTDVVSTHRHAFLIATFLLLEVLSYMYSRAWSWEHYFFFPRSDFRTLCLHHLLVCKFALLLLKTKTQFYCAVLNFVSFSSCSACFFVLMRLLRSDFCSRSCHFWEMSLSKFPN